jgi:cellulose synthase/poly-beta-1,6-N-acetylglucosamine synthase-like glycosyltransferase
MRLGRRLRSLCPLLVVKILFWVSLAALVWTHLGYALAAALAARLRRRGVHAAAIEPVVSVVVAAYNEEDVIERRVRNLLELDYPAERLEVLVASDSSADRTDEIVEGLAAEDARVKLVRCPRGGKVAAQNRGVHESSGEIVAFSDANALWQEDALRKLVRSFADPAVGYVSGRASYEAADGTNREGAYWRFELWLRGHESRLGSITAGNGPIYAVRRTDWVDLEPWCGHDLGLPYLMVQRGRRAVYDPEAVSIEKPSRDLEDEYRRKVRMLRGAWVHVFRGMLRRVGPVYFVELVSHRLLRYGSGILHLLLLVTSVALVGEGWVYRAALVVQLAWLALAAAGRLRLPIPGAGLAYYYLLVTWATLAGLARYLRFGPPLLWERIEGTR